MSFTRPTSTRPTRRPKWALVLLVISLVVAVTVVQISFLSNVSNMTASTMAGDEQQIQTEQLYLAKVDALSGEKKAQHTVLNRNITMLLQTLMQKEAVLTEKEKALTEKEEALSEQEKAHESQLVAAHRAQILLKRQARNSPIASSLAGKEGTTSTDITKATKFKKFKLSAAASRKGVVLGQTEKIMGNSNRAAVTKKMLTTSNAKEFTVSTSANSQNPPASGITDESSSISAPEKKHSCLNEDFTNTYNRAVFSLLIPKEEKYITAARVMGASVNLHTNETDKVMLELSTHPLSRNHWAQLQRAGWTHKCTISPIRPLRVPSPRFMDQFSKLHVWGMTVYDVAVYMDADTVAVRDLNDLMHLQLGSDYKIGVTADYRVDYRNTGSKGDWVDTFNMGMFMIHPDWTEYQRLIQLQEGGAIHNYEYIMAEQGWLNVVYKDQWKDVGLVYNANVAGRHHPKFKENENELRIIHYTTMKPWHSKSSSPDHDILCKPWLDIQDEVITQSGCINEDFVPPTDNRVAMVTFVTDMGSAETLQPKRGEDPPRKRDKADYTYGAAALLKSIQQHVGDTVDHILLEIPTRRLPDSDRAYLKELGWNICTVTPIEAKHKPFGRFVDQFNKFHLWSFIEYDKIIYLDSDTLVTGSIDKLISANLTDSKMIGVTQDYFGIKFVNTFNMGVFLIHPKLTEFHRLMKLQANDEVTYTHHQAEQGFLNAVYHQQWQEIGIEHNANFAVYASKSAAWPAKPKILHFTLEKPWQESVPTTRSIANHSRLDAFLQIWVDTASQYGTWPPNHTITTIIAT